MTDYRVRFRGVFPLLQPSGNPRHVYDWHCTSRQDADAIFAEEPKAFQIDRWEPEIKAWVMLSTRDRQS